MPFTAYVPKGPTRAWPVLYLLHGGSSHHAEWGQKVPLERRLEPYNLLVVMPEGEHGLYLNGFNGQRYAEYILSDVLPFAEARLGARADRASRAVGGLSMGGFGAFHLGLTRPDLFCAIASLSGAFGMTWWNLGRRPGSPYLPVLGPDGSGTREWYNPWRVLERAVAAGANLPLIWMDTGQDDDPDLVRANRDLHQSLTTAGIDHRYGERPGGHDWGYWARATPELLAFVGAAVTGTA